MIYEVSLPLIIILSIVSIIIILARKIPDISLEAEVKKDWLNEEVKKQHRATVLFCHALVILEKTLRQLRIHILKLDVKIFSLIEYLREKSAKRLNEINKLTHKSFAPIMEKKVNKFYSAAKSQGVGREITSAPSAQARPVINFLPAVKSIKIPEQSEKVLIKTQFNIEERKLLHIIAKNPKNAENYKKLGALYFKNDNLIDAEAAFDEYLKLNPSDNQIREILEKIVLLNKNHKSVFLN